VETDCPFLAPAPFRGKRCEPSMVEFTAKALGELHGLSLEEISAVTSTTAAEFFGREVPV
ncbi:MAG: TatD family hydrolase, partial [Verrucomicrobiales bacterium]